jgi:hypothetical protein
MAARTDRAVAPVLSRREPGTVTWDDAHLAVVTELESFRYSDGWVCVLTCVEVPLFAR